MHRSHRGLVWSLRAGLLALFGASLDCATLEKIDTNTCGNGVVDYEKGEDCDGFGRDGAACGKAGTPTACKLDCSKAADGSGGKCPSGWGCGLDAVCRPPSGTFGAKASLAVPADAFKLDVGDFDGDGRLDVLSRARPGVAGTSRARVHFVDGAALQTVLVPGSYAISHVADVNGDGLADLPLSNGGLGVLYGTRQRGFAPLVSPSFRRKDLALLIPVYAQPVVQAEAGTAVVVAYVGPGGQLSIDVSNASGEVLGTDFGSLPGLVGATPEDIRFETGQFGAPLRLLGGSSSPTVCAAIGPATCTPCGDVVVWSTKGQTASIIRPCEVQTIVDPDSPGFSTSRFTLTPNPKRLSISVPADAGVITQVRVGEFDGFPANPDLFIQTSKGQLFFVPGPAFNNTGAPINTEAADYQVLATGDLNGDGLTDIVSSRFVAISQFASRIVESDAGDAGRIVQPYLDQALVYLRQGAPWTEVVVADFTGDGRPDVVARTDGSTELDFLGGAGFATVPSTIQATGPVTRMQVGDFDGDLTPDLAFAVRNLDGVTDDVYIAYGRAGTAPGEPILVAAGQADLRQLLNLRQSRSNGFGDDIDDLGIVTWNRAASTTELVVAFGSSSRVPIALFGPTRLDSAIGNREQRAELFIDAFSGRFRANGTTTSPKDLLGLSLVQTSRRGGDVIDEKWFAHGILADGAAYAQPRFLSGSNKLPTELNLKQYVSWLGNLTGDTRDELVLLSGGKAGLKLDVIAVAATANASDLGVIATTVASENVAGALDAFSELHGWDLTDDGRTDLVLLPAAQAPGSGAQPQMLVQSGNGTFGKPELVPMQSFGLAFAQVSVAEGRTLISVSKSGVSRHKWSEGSWQTTPLAFDDDLTLRSPTGLAAGDFNGDGLDDLAIADGGVVRIFLQLACTDRACREAK
jgi:hypothetical protein